MNTWGEATAMLDFHIGIRNISNDAKNVFLKKIIIDTVATSSNSFCWGVCVSSTTYVSPIGVNIDAGEENNEFVGDYYAAETHGISTVMYVFFDEANVNDSVSVIVNYNTREERGLSIADSDGHICESFTFDVTAEVFPVIASEFNVINFADAAANIKVKKLINEGDTLAETTNTFWWGGTEYDADIYESEVVSIGSLEGNKSFQGSYFPGIVTGTSIVSYEFFDADNKLVIADIGHYESEQFSKELIYSVLIKKFPTFAVLISKGHTNSITITVNYYANTNAIGEETKDVVFSNAYPNPASSFVKFDYQFNDNYDNAKVVIYNLLGAEVNETLITGMNGTITINTGEMNRGVYFYSLVVEGKAVVSKKLIVK